MRHFIAKMCLGIIVLAACSIAARADLENENLLVSLPPGYKIDFQKKQGNSQITEMVPIGETVNNWTEMVTVQVFFGMKNVSPQQFKARMEQLWANACPNSQSKPLNEVTNRGYPSMMWIQQCPNNQQTRKPENTWFRAIQGRDSFYVVQKAYKFTPTKEQEAQWITFLNGVSVCDSRMPEAACPKTKQ